MKKYILLIIAIATFASCSKVTENARKIEDFNFDWRFTLGDSSNFSQAEYNDSTWRALHLPHDWAIEGNFSKDNPSTPSGGALPGGIGWYRKHFTTDDFSDKVINVEFDGVFMNSTVWVNGKQVGHRPYGYSSFSYDITPFLNAAGTDNVIAVKCDNSLQPNSRWYSGCGIYRNVRLVSTSKIFVDYSGTYITTPKISETEATINIAVTIENKNDSSEKIKIQNKILNTNVQSSVEYEIAAKSKVEIPMQLTVKNPQQWNIENPYIYTLSTTIEQNGKTLDNYASTFGIREFKFDPEKGFILNGKRVKILGVCQHHDMGALGSAVHVRALQRQLEILKEMGCNAIRTSHNPPAPELLDLCDKMGFIVMDEAFDMWRKAKTTYDYSLYFDEWHAKDLTDFIKRDRNHPSIFIWSIGNEILEQWNDSNDNKTLNAEEANLMLNYRSKMSKKVEGMNESMMLTSYIADTARALDATRPITAGCNGGSTNNNLLRSGALDIISYNYHENEYDSLHVWFSGKPILASETTSAIQSRGVYYNPSSKDFIQPLDWRVPYDSPEHQCSAYDKSRVPWGAFHEAAWLSLRNKDFISGMYIWTGFDYIGEPTPYSWPSRSSYFGIIDLCGFPKDAYYMYKAEWTNETTLHVFPHWNWTKGEKIDVWAYYNNADEVELLVNGKSLGRKSKTADCLHCIWEGVTFEPGEITAISYKNGVEVMRQTRKTADAPAKLLLTADRPIISADGYDLSFITIEATDANGNFAATANNQLSFKVEGAGELVGVDNGNAAGLECLKGDKMKLFNGKALAIVRSLRNKKGTATLTVNGDGIEQNSIKITTK